MAACWAVFLWANPETSTHGLYPFVFPLLVFVDPKTIEVLYVQKGISTCLLQLRKDGPGGSE
jgi:hypothetical protein